MMNRCRVLSSLAREGMFERAPNRRVCLKLLLVLLTAL